MVILGGGKASPASGRADRAGAFGPVSGTNREKVLAVVQRETQLCELDVSQRCPHHGRLTVATAGAAGLVRGKK